MYSERYIRAKAVVIGDYGVGKTTLIKSFLKGKPISDISYKPTIGVDVYKKEIKYVTDHGETITLMWDIWDLSGQVGFQKICHVYLKGAICGIAVFDVSRKRTLENISKWIDYYIKYAGKHPLLVVGNKIDLRGKPEITCITYEEGITHVRKISQKVGLEIPYIETSALHNINVEEAFDKLARLTIKRQVSTEE